QAEALRRVEGGALDPAVIERDALRLAVFEEQFAVIHAGERLADDGLDPARVHAGAIEKQVVGHGEVAHQGLRLTCSRLLQRKYGQGMAIAEGGIGPAEDCVPTGKRQLSRRRDDNSAESARSSAPMTDS